MLMSNEEKWLIIDNKGNIVSFDPNDKNLSMIQIISKNIENAKHYTTRKNLFDYIRKFLKGDSDE